MFECAAIDLDKNILSDILKSKTETDLWKIIKKNEVFKLTINFLNKDFR